MTFPIKFVQSRGDYDFISPAINFIGIASLVTVGSISLGAISLCAFRVLNLDETAGIIATALPVSDEEFMLTKAVVSGCLVSVTCYAVTEVIKKCVTHYLISK